MATVSILKQATKKTLMEINELMNQLRSYQRKPDLGSLSGLRELITDKNSTLVVARDTDRIVGTAILSIIIRIGRRTGHVNDVIVRESYRGQGLGEKMMRKIIAVAKAKRATSLELTSRPSRTAAHKLYKKLGFEKKETEVFTLKF